MLPSLPPKMTAAASAQADGHATAGAAVPDGVGPASASGREPRPIRPTALWARSRRTDFVAAYGELDDLCERMQFGWSLSLREWCDPSDWVLLELARHAQPPPPAALPDGLHPTIAAAVGAIIDRHHWPMRNELRRLEILIDEFARRRPELVAYSLSGLFARCADRLITRFDQEDTTSLPGLCHAGQAAPGATPRTGDPRGAVAIARCDAIDGEAAAGLRPVLTVVEALSRSTADPDLDIIGRGLHALLASLSALAGAMGRLAAGLVPAPGALPPAARRSRARPSPGSAMAVVPRCLVTEEAAMHRDAQPPFPAEHGRGC